MVSRREILRRLRERGLTLKEVAQGVGVTPSYVSGLLSGRRRPDPSKAHGAVRFYEELSRVTDYKTTELSPYLFQDKSQ